MLYNFLYSSYNKMNKESINSFQIYDQTKSLQDLYRQVSHIIIASVN